MGIDICGQQLPFEFWLYQINSTDWCCPKRILASLFTLQRIILGFFATTTTTTCSEILCFL